MPFKSGAEWNGNRKGQPRKPEVQLFRDALVKVEKEKNTSLLEHAVKRAFVEDNVLIAVMKKMLPDLSQDEGLRDLVRTYLVRPK